LQPRPGRINSHIAVLSFFLEGQVLTEADE
jgi:hypothetical protein